MIEQKSKFNPFYLLTRVKRRIKYRIIAKYIRNRRARYPEVFKTITGALKTYWEGGGFKYNFDQQVWKLFSIYDVLDQYQPEVVWELGSGSTTSVLNLYSLNNSKDIIVYDESEKWVENTTGILVKTDGLSDRTKIYQKERILDPKVEGTAYRYNSVPEQNIDLMIIDGPSCKTNGVRLETTYNSDFAHLAERKLPAIVMIDNRKSTFDFIKTKYSKYYDIFESSNWSFYKKKHDIETMSAYSIFHLKEEYKGAKVEIE